MKSILKSAAFLFVTIAVGMGVQSCNSVKTIDKTQLSGYWALKTLEGEKAEDAFKGSIPSLSFDFDKNSVFGNSGCNSYFGEFSLDEKNEFSAPRLAGTLMLCIDENKEPEFLKALGTEKLVLQLDNNEILSFKKGDKTLLEFVKGTAPAANVGVQAVNAETLAGTWVLESMADEDVNALFADRKPTIVFNADGSVNGNAGCNNYRSNYNLTENTLSIGNMMMTKMACPSLEGEGKYSKALSTQLQATINGNKLILMQQGKDVLTFVKKAK